MLDLLRHELEILVFVAGGVLDPEGEDLGHPAGSTLVVGPFRGLVQPRSSRERASAAARDVNVGDYRIFLEGAAIGAVDADMVVRKADAVDVDLNGDYRILFVGNAAGQGHHLELDASRTT